MRYCTKRKATNAREAVQVLTLRQLVLFPIFARQSLLANQILEYSNQSLLFALCSGCAATSRG